MSKLALWVVNAIERIENNIKFIYNELSYTLSTIIQKEVKRASRFRDQLNWSTRYAIVKNVQRLKQSAS